MNQSVNPSTNESKQNNQNKKVFRTYNQPSLYSNLATKDTLGQPHITSATGKYNSPHLTVQVILTLFIGWP